jgi:hypothetical protein
MFSDFRQHGKKAEDRTEFSILELFVHLGDWKCAVAVVETNSPLVKFFEVSPGAAVRCNDRLTLNKRRAQPRGRRRLPSLVESECD